MDPASAEHSFLLVLRELIVILVAARIGASIARRFGQPQVCGEIAAGLILGPSVLGHLLPGVAATVFDPSVSSVFAILSEIGLMLLLAIVGMEVDFSHLSHNGRNALAVSLAGVLSPFVLGLLLARILYKYLGAGFNHLAFDLFIAMCLSITALPVLGRILLEFSLNRTAVGVLALSAAAVDDVIGWIILGGITAFVQSTFAPMRVTLTLLEVLAYSACMIAIIRPLMVRWSDHMLSGERECMSGNILVTFLVLVFTSGIITSEFGIFPIFGAFLMGAIIYDQNPVRHGVLPHIKTFVTVFFLPLFFTYTGLRTDIGTIRGVIPWALSALVILVAVAGKLGACSLAGLITGLDLREACALGALMNTRGLMELVALNVGLDVHAFPKSVFSIFVLMAVVTTLMTTPILSRLVGHGSLTLAGQQAVSVKGCPLGDPRGYLAKRFRNVLRRTG